MTVKQRTSKSIWGTVLMPSEKSEISARKFPGQNWKIKRKCEQLEKRWAKYESHHNNLVITAWKVPKYRVFSGSFFPAFWLNTYWVQMRENTDHKNSVYGHFSRSVWSMEQYFSEDRLDGLLISVMADVTDIHVEGSNMCLWFGIFYLIGLRNKKSWST